MDVFLTFSEIQVSIGWTIFWKITSWLNSWTSPNPSFKQISMK